MREKRRCVQNYQLSIACFAPATNSLSQQPKSARQALTCRSGNTILADNILHLAARSTVKRLVRIAIVGDIHGHFDNADLAYFNRSADDLLLFVGDLCQLVWPPQTRRVARCIAQLEKPTLFIAGNHDVGNGFQLLAELKGWRRLARLAGLRHLSHHRRLGAWLGGVPNAGYSVHPFQINGVSFDVIVGRPYALGGSALTFAPFMKRCFGVDTLEDSVALLMRRVDQTQSGRLIFLAHNGPHGLGDRPSDIWGCDFAPERGDWGDQDLTQAIAYARGHGKQVLAVAAGHMHQRTRQGGQRSWHVERDGTHYINAARVPRVYAQSAARQRHHVRLELAATGVTVHEVAVSSECSSPTFVAWQEFVYNQGAEDLDDAVR